MSRSTDGFGVVLGGASRFQPEPGNVIAVAAGRGGAGASTVAALIALAAHAEGRAVLLVDAQPLGTLGLMLGVAHGPGVEALREGMTPDALVTPLGDQFGFIQTGGDALSSTAAERRALFRRLTGLFETYDTVVVDAGARLDGVVAACDAGAATLLAVVAPDPISLAAAHAVFKTAVARPGAPRFAAILNGAADGAADAAFAVLEQGVLRFLGRSLVRAGTLAEDPKFRAATTAGQPLIAAAYRSPLLDAAGAALHSLSRGGHSDATALPLTAIVQ